MSNTRPNRIYIFDQPRTCSMLFHRLLSKHPQLGHVFHHWSSPEMYGPQRIHMLLKPRDSTAGNDDFDTADHEGEFNVQINRIEASWRIPCIKDHLFSLLSREILLSKGASWIDHKINPTKRFTTKFLLSITHSIFLIRHPALMIKSFWKSQRTVFKLQPSDAEFMALTSLKWTEILHSWYVEQGRESMVIDAYDVVYNTRDVMGRVCKVVGIDPGGVLYEWEAEPEFEEHMPRMFVGKLGASTGVEREGSGAGRDVVDLEGLYREWREADGEEVAEQLRASVEEEMPVYERMRGRAMKFEKS